MTWRLSFIPGPDKHPDLEIERLRETFDLHPTAKVELLEYLTQAGLL